MVCESIWAGVPAENSVAPDGSAVLLCTPRRPTDLFWIYKKKKIKKIKNSETL